MVSNIIKEKGENFMWILLPFISLFGPFAAVIELFTAFLPMKLFDRIGGAIASIFN